MYRSNQSVHWETDGQGRYTYTYIYMYTHTPTHIYIRSDQSLSRVRLFATPWIAARQASLSITNSQSSLRLTPIESVIPSSHLILCRPLLLLPPIPPSIRVFSNEPTLRMRWPKYWSFSFSIIPSKVIPGLISFWMDRLDLLAENKDHGIWSHHFMGNRWGNSGNSVRLYFFWAPKSLQMVTAAMKLKDAYSLEGKLWPT